ncbi:hypothetical protein GCM10009787_41510 [Streptomyces bangladeshensis]|uniref:Uncharacterized protein n=1 Tax=Streptomyces bangladeshensis TaxID=295352 RepID=A0ABN3BNS3_9ACTN
MVFDPDRVSASTRRGSKTPCKGEEGALSTLSMERMPSASWAGAWGEGEPQQALPAAVGVLHLQWRPVPDGNAERTADREAG